VPTASRRRPWGMRCRAIAGPAICLLLMVALSACDSSPWNNPYPKAESLANIAYSSFSERPKHLDPVRSYSSNEYTFIGQIYEPPLQYHFLRRPYALVPLTAVDMPKVQYRNADGELLPTTAAEEDIAFSEYLLRIQPGIEYQPHPAFARDERGQYRYHQLATESLERVHALADFARQGTRTLTADDYLYQIKRLATPHLHSPISGLLADYIVGFKEFGARIERESARLRAESGEEAPYIDLRNYSMEGVEAPDEHTLRIRLKGKYPQFVYWLAMPFFAPMPWEADRFYSQPGLAKRNITLNWYPVGTGAYMLTENNPNLRMVLERNPNFRSETYPAEGEESDRESGLLDDAGRVVPFIERAVYNLEKENIPYWNKFLQGYYDTSGVSSDSFDQAVSFSNQGEATLTEPMIEKGIQLQTAVTSSSYYMGFNMKDPVVGGESERARLLRQAISIAVDFDEYVSIFANGRGVVAQGPLPPGVFGYREGEEGINPFVYTSETGQPRRRSLEEAKLLLERAGYANGWDAESGQPLVLYFDTTATGPDDKARLNWMRKQFSKLGIQLVIRATDYNRFQEKMRKGTAQMFMWGWNADYPDPENFLFLLYGNNSKVEYGGENAANFQHPEFDRLFDAMKNMQNGPERQEIIDRMVEIARREAPWIWGYHPVAFSLHHSWYKNVKPNLMAHNTLKYRRLDPVERQKKRLRWNGPVVWPLLALGLVLALSAVPAVRIYRRHERSAAR